MNIIHIISNGLFSIADSYVDPRRYTYPKSNGFQRDQEHLKSDVENVGRELKKTIDKYGREQSYKFTRI